MPAAATVSEARGLHRRGETALRAMTAVVLAAPAAAAVILGPPYLPIFVAAIAAIMAWEWVRVTGHARRALGLASIALAMLLIAAIAVAATARYGWAYAILAAAVPVIYGTMRAIGRPGALAGAIGPLYIGVPAISLLWLYARPEIGRELVIWLISIVIATDIAAYFAGRALRGPKLAPRVSPGKTWSGAAGGLAGAVAVGLGLGLALELARPLVLVAAALVFSLISQLGDLVESGLKRAFSVKDASGILPGHGGMMDRVDGIVAALVASALMIWIGGGDPRPWL
jgi:phosphatidate cytidylyltransferase